MEVLVFVWTLDQWEENNLGFWRVNYLRALSEFFR
jgi:hypothetical protein